MYYDIWNEANEPKILEKLGFTPVDLKPAVISARTVNEIKSFTEKNKDAGLIILRKPNEKVLKAAVQECAIDATDAFVEYPIIMKLSERNIAVLLNFNELLNADSVHTPRLIYLMSRTVRLCRKYKVPVMITSGASDKYSQRSVSELIAFGENLGMTAGEAKEALSRHQNRILERNRLKKAGKWIISGVQVV
ncbi:MAG: RNase P subunit p30 family protein [Candidatus Nanoarchaeia archaeon]|nr:RNase P subunit p30 family protein [Candidatus Nanoarchaeia archaeon]MDD5239516.1 RNase P subunit p30 family protein [Candidatus Nanoarchaeia archaeon]